MTITFHTLVLCLEVTLETIICSAVSVTLPGETSPKVWYGHRHSHALAAVYDELSWRFNRKDMSSFPSEQGFVTSMGRFVGRQEAFRIYTEGGGVSKCRDGFRGDSLQSEDLY